MSDVDKTRVIETLILIGREIGWKVVPAPLGTGILFEGAVRVIHQAPDVCDGTVHISHGLADKLNTTFDLLEKKFEEVDQADKKALNSEIYDLEVRVASLLEEMETNRKELHHKIADMKRASEIEESERYVEGVGYGRSEALSEPNLVSQSLLEFCTYQCPRSGGEIIRETLGGPRCDGCLVFKSILLGKVNCFPPF